MFYFTQWKWLSRAVPCFFRLCVHRGRIFRRQIRPQLAAETEQKSLKCQLYKLLRERVHVWCYTQFGRVLQILGCRSPRFPKGSASKMKTIKCPEQMNVLQGRVGFSFFFWADMEKSGKDSARRCWKVVVLLEGAVCYTISSNYYLFHFFLFTYTHRICKRTSMKSVMLIKKQQQTWFNPQKSLLK